MGWASGSSLFSDIIEKLNDVDIDDQTRRLLYEKLIPIFEDEDCDTLQECIGQDKIFDSVFYELYPEQQDDQLDFDNDDGC